MFVGVEPLDGRSDMAAFWPRFLAGTAGSLQPAVKNLQSAHEA